MQKYAKITTAIIGIVVFSLLVFGALHYSLKSPLKKAEAGTGLLHLQSLHTAEPSDSRHMINTLELELQKKPNHSPILLRLAQLSTESGKPAAAEKYLRQILAQEPNNLEARIELGRVLFLRGNVEGALAETQNALKLDAKNVDTLYNLGAIYGNINQDEQARIYWLQAIAAAPNSPSAQKAKLGLSQLKPGYTQRLEHKN
jgi:Flp pilus assembly protein TadD